MPELARHRCLVYDGDRSEMLDAVVPMFVDALSRNHRCLFIGDASAVGVIWGALADRGVDAKAQADRGALVFSSARPTGAFDPEATIESLRTLVDGALRDGFGGLCATGDMRFELGEDDASFERLLEYEARLDLAFRDLPLTGLCQYQRDSVPSRAVREALATHREVFVGRDLHRDNLFYVPPEVYQASGAGARDRVGDWMCQQLERLARAERRHDKAESELFEAYQRLEQRVRELESRTSS